MVERVHLLPRELSVGKALPTNLRHENREAVSIVQRVVFGGPVVIAKHLLVKVTIKVKRLNSNVGSAQAALHERPEIFYALRVYLAANILLDVVYSLVDVESQVASLSYAGWPSV